MKNAWYLLWLADCPALALIELLSSLLRQKVAATISQQAGSGVLELDRINVNYYDYFFAGGERGGPKWLLRNLVSLPD